MFYVVLRARPIVSSKRRAVFGVRCRNPGRCRGALELRDADGMIGRGRFDLRQQEGSERLHRIRVRFARRPARRVATLHVSGVRAYQASSFRLRLG